MNDTLDKVHLDTGRDQLFSMSFDGTKTPSKLQLSTAYKDVAGDVHPQHAIDVSKTNREGVRTLVAKGSGII